jgi:ATP-dependent helicase/nuclease subunit A
MLEWIWQTLENTDEIRVCSSEDLSTGSLWETGSASLFSTDSTFFPQKKGVWKVVFHNESSMSRVSQAVEKDPVPKAKQEAISGEKRVQDLLSGFSAKVMEKTILQEGLRAVSFTPGPLPIPVPLKMGVTALCRSLEEEETEGTEPLGLTEQPDNQAESVEVKRLPLPLTRPRLLADLPSLPAYLRGSPPQTALLRGMATHKALSLLPFEPLRDSARAESGRAPLEKQLASLLSSLETEGKLTPEERNLIHVPSLAGFFASPLGRRALLSPEVHREWSFNLRLPQLSLSILQGVIDLCFLEENAWVLVDFKTDRVESAANLWPLYHRQIEIYRHALASSTGYPVGESVLFSLPLGEGFSIHPDDVKITS